jgi:DNA invertase Pin-like site-specific DNA recombinase
LYPSPAIRACDREARLRLARLATRSATSSGIDFRSLRDPINPTTPQRIFSLQMLGAAVQLERALITERT